MTGDVGVICSTGREANKKNNNNTSGCQVSWMFACLESRLVIMLEGGYGEHLSIQTAGT